MKHAHARTQKKKNSVPLAVVVKLDQAKHEERHLLGFLLTCKDFRIISLFFLQPQAHKATQKIFKHFLFPTKLKYAPTPPTNRTRTRTRTHRTRTQG
jgi:hypothetical protein